MCGLPMASRERSISEPPPLNINDILLGPFRVAGHAPPKPEVLTAKRVNGGCLLEPRLLWENQMLLLMIIETREAFVVWQSHHCTFLSY